MKKVLCLLVILTLAMTMLLVSCNQEEQQGSEQSSEQTSEQVTIPTEPSEGLEFRSSGDGTCALIGIGTCTDTYIVIPDTSPEGERVTFIESGALSGCDHLVGIQLPASLEYTGGAFVQNCSNLVSITVAKGNTLFYSKNNCLIGIDNDYFSSTRGDYEIVAGCKTSIIPDEIASIGDSAFSGCTGLSNIIIPDGVTNIGDGAFYGCTGLTNFEIPDSVTNIGAGAFGGCSGLTEIEIPDSVLSIGDHAFAECTTLTEMVIPEGVETIGYGLIDGCENLQSISFPSTLTRIGSEYSANFLGGGPALTSIIVAPDNPVYYSVDNCLIETSSGTMIAGCKTSVIPSNVTSIGMCAFAGTDIQEITIPASVVSIDVSAFHGCTDLESINVASGNEVYHSINNCVIETETGVLIMGLKNSIIPESVTSIGNAAFISCSNLSGIVIPNSVTSIDIQAFGFCTGLTSITIPDSVTLIEEMAFYECSSLTSVTIGSGVTRIGSCAFSECNSLTDIYFTGTEQEWNSIEIDEDNVELKNATIHYNYIPEE